jgi:hypothetical protein
MNLDDHSLVLGDVPELLCVLNEGGDIEPIMARLHKKLTAAAPFRSVEIDRLMDRIRESARQAKFRIAKGQTDHEP